jgi:hypothetical protein
MAGGTHVAGTGVAAWVTSVNPDHAIKGRDEPCWGFPPPWDSRTAKEEGV